jgi:CHAT domain-containing protein
MNLLRERSVMGPGTEVTARPWLWAVAALAVYTLPPAGAAAQTGTFVAPPRTIADITAVLDREKPDQAKSASAKADADAAPPVAADKRALARFYFRRAQARAFLGRTREAIDDCEKAIEYAGDFSREEGQYEQFLSNQYGSLGDFKRVIEINQSLARSYLKAGRKGPLFAINARIVGASLQLGDLKQAETYVKASQALLNESRSWKNQDNLRSFFEGYTQAPYADLLFRRGRYREAELAYHQSQALVRDALAKSASWPIPPLKDGFESKIDVLLAAEGVAKQAQGRLAEAELDIRGALLSRLKTVGKFSGSTANITRLLANLLLQQARPQEAEQMASTAVDIYRQLGYRQEVQGLALALNDLGTILAGRQQWNKAAAVYASLDEATKDWEPARRERVRSSANRIFTEYHAGHVAAGIELAQAMLATKKNSVGEKHVDYAIAQAILGAGLVFAHRDAEAMQIYKTALPALLADSRQGDDDPTFASGYERNRQRVIQPYLSLLARTPDPAGAYAAESFQLGELIRGSSVQRAVTNYGARAAARDPGLSDLMRKQQDLETQIRARLGVLNNELGLPPEQRDDKAVAEVRSDIDKLRAESAKAEQEVKRRFPKYADLVYPKPPTLEDAKALLRPDEALLSFYLGDRSSFVWAIRKDGPIAFAEIKANASEIEAKIKKLREALEPNATTVEDVPRFDLGTAHGLYALLLQPVESGWKPAKSLIVETNGALGALPLSLLPTESFELAERGPLFSGYRDVPWLARTHSVTMVASAAALLTLRRLPPASPRRETLVGFGDPVFNEQEALEAASEQAGEAVLESRGAPANAAIRGTPLKLRASPRTEQLDRAELALLPRLPDTALELKAIAQALGADPVKSLHLGKDANERTVRTIDLSRFRIIDFATHGLVPGDLDGLTQPALALTAPGIAGIEGDGLLTMEKILSLKLDADWVILSACNTAAGAGAGAEAASGLARAFFYAGARAVLVTNWSVHSVSARELITDLFRRQSADPRLARGEALRQAMNAMIDGGSFVDSSGKTLYTYAHPLFWAPYTVIGDGGGGP